MVIPDGLAGCLGEAPEGGAWPAGLEDCALPKQHPAGQPALLLAVGL